MKTTMRPRLAALGAWLALAAASCLLASWGMWHPERRWAWLEAAAAATLLLGGAVAAVLRRRHSRAEHALAAERERQRDQGLRFNTAINHMSQGLCFFDGQLRLIVCNQRYATIYKLQPEDVLPGTTLEQIVDRRHAAGTTPEMTRDQYLAWRSGVARRNDPSDTVAELRDGRMIAIHHQPMSDGGWVATHEDVTERRRALAQIERLAHHDPLTGLANRLSFRTRFEAALRGCGSRETPDAAVAVLCLDLDRFKAVNDTLGHPAGDELLCAVAGRLLDCVRDGDVVARLGGDEFAIVQCGGRQPAAARALGDRIVRALGEPFGLRGQTASVGVSVGVALAPLHGSDPEDLLKKADVALYSTKAGGRGGCALFDPAIDAEVQDRRQMEADLAQAAARGELELRYQPLVTLTTPGGKRITAREALLRWRHPQRGLVEPDVFIPLAEATGSIEALGAWVLHEAFAQAATWPRGMAVAVNLSPLQIESGRIVAHVAGALRSSGLAPSRVELEITESVPLFESETNLATLHALRDLGVRVCLDDFGVGYSSLGYLRAFPFDKLKIDRSFVRDIVHNPQAAAIVGSIVALAHHLGMRVAGEGVETQQQLALLQGMGCDEAQGWLFGRAQPAGTRDAQPPPAVASRF